MQRTFRICDADEAAANLPMPPREAPEVSAFHPLMVVEDTVFVCVHDDANGTQQPYQIPQSLIDNCESADDLERYISRVHGAALN